jgi:hypothetical protein
MATTPAEDKFTQAMSLISHFVSLFTGSAQNASASAGRDGIDPTAMWQKMGGHGQAEGWFASVVDAFNKGGPEASQKAYRDVVWQKAGQQGEMPEWMVKGQWDGPGGAKEFFFKQQGYNPNALDDACDKVLAECRGHMKDMAANPKYLTAGDKAYLAGQGFPVASPDMTQLGDFSPSSPGGGDAGIGRGTAGRTS